MAQNLKLAAPCGLYCGVCSTFLEGVCHGCGCKADDCFAAKKHGVCTIFKCTQRRGFLDCSLCNDFPCTELIQFAFDPVMRTHLPVINNLVRRRKVGIEAWVEEQEKYWNENPNRFDEWIRFHEECKKKRRETSKGALGLVCIVLFEKP